MTCVKSNKMKHLYMLKTEYLDIFHAYVSMWKGGKETSCICVSASHLHKSLVCGGAVYVQVHVTGKCEAITGFDRVKSFGGADDVLFLSSYGVTTEFSTVDSY